MTIDRDAIDDLTWSEWERIASDEDEHLHDLRLGKGSNEGRQRYARWLTARQDQRGETLELALRLIRDLPSDEHEATRARLAECLAKTNLVWWKIVRPTEILNCGRGSQRSPQERFVHPCPNAWETLPRGDRAGARRCADCGEHVGRCETATEAEQRALRGQALAVPRELVEQSGQETESRRYIGRGPTRAETWAQKFLPDSLSLAARLRRMVSRIGR